MSLLKTLLSAATAAIAAKGIHAKTLILDGNQCPNGWSLNAQNNGDDNAYCCYGSSVINGDDAYCCVRDTSSSFSTGPDTGKFSGGGVGGSPGDPCFPFCDTTTKFDKRAFPTPSCAEKVPFTASDYSERVSAASKSVAAKASKTSGSEPNSASPQTTDASSTESDGSSDTDVTAASGTETSTNAGPIATADGVLFAAAVAAIGLAFP